MPHSKSLFDTVISDSLEGSSSSHLLNSTRFNSSIDLPVDLPLDSSVPAHLGFPEFETTYPLSPMQAGMLFHALYAENSGVDIEQLVCTLHEPLNVERFEQAWQQVVERHPILRTGFDWENQAQPQQQVHRFVKICLQQQDWRSLSPAEQQERLQAYLACDRQQGFDLRQAPLMRLMLCQLADAEYQLIWSFHHILLDGRSLPIVLKEVFGLYAALGKGEPLPSAPPRPYQHYIAWLQQQDWSMAQSFWQQTLAEFSAPTTLPRDPASSQAAPGQSQVTVQLSEATTAALKQFAQQHYLTVNTLFQGAWALVLGYYSGSRDVVFGATRACRHGAVEDSKEMVGLFINTLPLRVPIALETPLLEWLQHLRQQNLALRPYEHTPLPQVQQWSEVPSGTPLFESLVVFENYDLTHFLHQEGGSWANRTFQLLEKPNYPLILGGNLGTELTLRLTYDRQQFSATTMQPMLRQVATLLEQMVAQPQARLGDLSGLSAAERQQILVEWNATEVEYDQTLRLQDLFEAQVERSPGAIAAIFNDQTLTYAQLNQRANQLAHHLQGLGVGPEVPVGICIERSLEMIVALMAVAKAGGAYVPLDPTYPAERLAHIFSDSQLAVVLTQEKFLSLLPPQELPIFCMDRDWPTLATAGSENPVSPVHSRNLAYIIYTSGSTGKPKGVLIDHRGAVNTILDINRRFQVTAADRVLGVSSLNFDLSVYDIFGLLAIGGAVVIPQPAIAPEPDHWLELMHRHQVTLWNSAPPVLQMLAGYALDRQATFPDSLKLVMLSGDWIPLSLPGLMRQLTPGNPSLKIFSLGGATEASIWSIFYPIDTIEASWKSIPYGKPLANQQFYVLNEALQPVPVGAIGDLYIGGHGVARGYLNRPDLNQAKFIPDPFRPEAGACLYHTGDLGRYRPDGNIEFLGRIDHQVKIRGFRVELGEIEAVLCQHPAIRETAILAQADLSGTQRLVAYLVAERTTVAALTPGALVEEVRSFLQDKLPHYMIPSALIPLETLPLTPNGKLDRKALPIPDFSNPALAASAEANFVAPRNAIEQQLADIWQTYLEVKPISVTANFFELGGHSLLAVQLWPKVEQVFQRKLHLSTLFQAPTIAQLAAQLQQDPDSQPPTCPSLVVINPGEPDASRPPLFCIHVLGRGLKFYRPMMKYLDPRQPVYGLSTHITEEGFASQGVEALADHYLQQIRLVQPQGPYHLAGISFGGLVAYDIAQKLLAQGQEVAFLGLLDTRLSAALHALPQKAKFSEHWQHLSTQGVQYLFGKAQEWVHGKSQNVFANVQTCYTHLGIKICRSLGRPLPEDWQDLLYEEENLQLTDTYTPERYPGSITLFKALDQGLGVGILLEPELGWRDLVQGDLIVHEVPGDHLGMLKEPSARILGELLNQTLQNCRVPGAVANPQKVRV